MKIGKGLFKKLSFMDRSIGLTQSLFVLLFSIAIGCFLTTIVLSYNLQQKQEKVITLAQEILTTAEGGATTAAWTLHKGLANEVIVSLLALTDIQAASLSDDHGNLLATASKSHKTKGALNRWLAKKAFEHLSFTRDLAVSIDNRKQRIGTLALTIDGEEMVSDFLTLAKSIILTVMGGSLLIGLAMLWLSTWYVTKPLEKLALTVANIDPDQPQNAKLPILARHKNDELGHLIRLTNAMLERLRKNQEQLSYLATKDPLTNLPNRSLITDRLLHALGSAKRNGSRVAVFFLDLDHFKKINDTRGHNVGDILLKEVATRIKSVMLLNDSVGRLGGDEFLIVVENANELKEIAYKAKRIGDILSESFNIQDQAIYTSVSIGISVFPEDGSDIHTLMRCADLAMYEAKATDTCWHFFTPAMSERMEARIMLDAALEQVIVKNELYLLYQPKVFSQSGIPSGAEALLRWRNAPCKLSTLDFIKISEENGAILKIGAWVLEEVCRQINQWQEELGMLISVAVNVSAIQLRSPGFVADVLKLKRKYNIGKNVLELEITETVLLGALKDTKAVLSNLRDAGIIVTIDDFGTGYSSLSYLSELPVDILKIDKSFISGRNPSRAVLQMIVSMAKTLKLKTVAEGVETNEQRQWLIGEGCDYLQGYLINKPLSQKDFINYYKGKPLSSDTWN